MYQGSIFAMNHLTDIYAKMYMLAEVPKFLHIGNQWKDAQLADPVFNSLLEEQIGSFFDFSNE